MNVLFLINYAGNAGTEKYVENLQKEFSRMGHKCFLAYNVAGQLSETMITAGVATMQLNLGRNQTFKAAKLLAEYCKDNNIDIIHAQYPRENIIAIESLKFYSAPKIVFTVHLSGKQNIKWKILNKFFAKKNHAIIALYEDAIPTIASNGLCKSKIHVVYNGVRTQTEHVQYQKDVFNMCIMARYAAEKGLDFLVESLRLLKDIADRDFMVYILGDGELFKEISAKIRRLDLDHNICQVGFTKEPEKYLKDSSLYLCSSKTSEAMSFAILEAFSFGLPCVATDVGGNSKLILENGTSGALVRNFNPEAFANAIKVYMDDADLWKEHSKAATDKIKRIYSVEESAIKTLEVYK